MTVLPLNSAGNETTKAAPFSSAGLAEAWTSAAWMKSRALTVTSLSPLFVKTYSSRT